MDSSSDDNAHITEVSDTDYEQLPRQSETYPPRRGQRVLATVYDAVAGRVTYDKVLRDEDLEHNQLPTGVSQQRPSSFSSTRGGGRDHHHVKLAPEDVLFRRKDAPERYEEHDIYRAHERDLLLSYPSATTTAAAGAGLVLPESELLQAVHSYSSQFYGALNRDAQQRLPRVGGGGGVAVRRRRNVDECSMDETALLAFGILLEEAAREVLGRRGHLVFTEPAADDDGQQQEEPGGARRRGGGGDGGGAAALDSSSKGKVKMAAVVVGHQNAVGSTVQQRLGPKRRRLAKTEDEEGGLTV
ncbi:hypothetical protein PT974_11286 [Cladobotryum mycophilum]|uniref:Uncharacterized protein n=1 Tax=Cladobotryum mycophilum TaxID=491253 RepID=A0ABR0S4S9_9HYPO